MTRLRRNDPVQALSKSGPALRRSFRTTGVAVGAAAALLTLDACTVGPDFVKPEAKVNTEWAQKDSAALNTAATADSAWWKAFNDPALDRLVELAYTQNLPLQIAGLRIVEARAQLGFATGPAVSPGAGRLRQARPPWASARTTATYIPGFDSALWELPGGLRRGLGAGFLGQVPARRARRRAASAARDRSPTTTARSSRSPRRSRAPTPSIRTFEVLIEQARAERRAPGEGAADRRVALPQRRHLGARRDPGHDAAGEHPRLHPPAARSACSRLENALSTLLGQPTGTVDALARRAARRSRARPRKVAVSVPAEMLRRRPDIRSAELFAAAQCARIGVAKADLYPSFSLFGTIGLQASSSGSGVARTCSRRDSLFYVGRPARHLAVLQLRPHQEQRARRGRALPAAARRLPQHRAQGGAGGRGRADRLPQRPGGGGVRAERRDAPRSDRWSWRSCSTARAPTDYQRVLDAQRSLLQQQNSLAQTRSSVATNLIALYKALGGGWELRQGQPVVPERTQNEMKERTNWGDMLVAAAARPEAPTDPPPASTRRPDHGQEDLEADSKWIIAAVAVAVVGVHRLPVLAERRRTRCPRGSPRATAGIEAKLVDVAAKEPLRVKEILVDEGDSRASPARCWCGWTPSRWRPSWPRPRRTSRPPRSGWRSPRPPSSSRRARSTSPRSRPSARASSSQEGAGSQRELRRPHDEASRRPRPRSREDAGDAADRHAGGRGRAGQRRRRSRPASTTRRSSRRSRDECCIAWPSPARSSAPGGKALTLVNLEDIYMEIFLPSEQAAAREDRRRGADHRRLRSRAARSPGTSASSPRRRSSRPSRSRRSSEREKLMFRVKIQLPKELVSQLHRAHQDRRPRRRLRQGRRLRGLAGAAAEPGRRPGSTARCAPVTPEISSHGVTRVSPSLAGSARPAGRLRSRTSPTATARSSRSTASRSTFPRGIMVGIVGPDGVGKSTLMALIAGSQEAAGGQGDRPRRRHRRRPAPARRVPADRVHAAGPGQEPLPGAQRPRQRRLHGAALRAVAPRSARSASRSCSTPPGSARSPIVPPASSRAA